MENNNKAGKVDVKTIEKLKKAKKKVIENNQTVNKK